MASLNKVEMLCQLTREPEASMSSTGVSVCTFGVMTTMEVPGINGGPVQETCLAEVEAYGQVGELAKIHFHSGNWIYLDGRLRYESWTDPASGYRRNRLVIIADNLQMAEQDGSAVPEHPADDTHLPPQFMQQDGDGMPF